MKPETQQYLAAFDRSLPIGSTVSLMPGNKVSITLTCAEGHQETIAFGKRMPPEAALRMIASKGWIIKNKRATCPNHTRTRNVDKATEKTPKVEQTTAERTALAKKARRDAIAWIDEAFDVERGQYRHDHSDATIAGEVGLSEKAVAELREEFYGPIKMPREIAEVAKRVDELNKSLKECADETEKRWNDLRRQVVSVQVQLAELRQKNGW